MFNKTKRHVIKNEYIFGDLLNNEAFYWLGFLAADGCIHKQKKGGQDCVSLELSIIDIEHINKFKFFLDCSNPVTTREQYKYKINNVIIDKSFKFAAIRLYSQIISDTLTGYGITPKKTFSLDITNKIILNNKNFWRGVIDGDGSIFQTKDRYKKYKDGKFYRDSAVPRIRLIGSLSLCNSFKEYCLKYIDSNGSVLSSGKIFSYEQKGKNAYFLIEHFYKDSQFYLNRKYEKAMEILDFYKNRYNKNIVQ